MYGNASSHATANRSVGPRIPASTLDTVDASHGTVAPRSASVIWAASRARRTSAPKKCAGDALGSSSLAGMTTGSLRLLRIDVASCGHPLCVAGSRLLTPESSPGLAPWVAGSHSGAHSGRESRAGAIPSKPARTRKGQHR
jgi:hypothetical protein